MAGSEELKIIITAEDKAGDVLKKSKGDFIDLGDIAKGALTIGLTAAAAGAAALGTGLVTSTLAAMDAQNVQADLQAVLKSTGMAAGVTAEQANLLASRFQDTTRFEDDVTLKGEAMLLTFTNIGKNVFPMATEAMLNMGQKFGSVDAAALQLGKALNDPISGVTALRRVGVMLTDQQEEAIKQFMALGDVESAQKIILKELEVEFGGLAVAAGQTFGGKLDILKNKFGDIQETIGGAMLPILTKLADKLIETLNKPEVQVAIAAISRWLEEQLPKAVDAAASLLGDLSENGITGVLKTAQVWVNDPATQEMLKNVGSQLGSGVVDGIKAAVTSAPVWASIGLEIGKAAVPIIGGTSAAILQGIMESIGAKLGLTPAQIETLLWFGSPPGRQGGGSVSSGAAYLVGEVGPELFVPGASGSVIPNHALATVGAGAGAGGPGLTFVYSPMMSLSDEREMRTRLVPVLDAWYQDAKRRRV